MKDSSKTLSTPSQNIKLKTQLTCATGSTQLQRGRTGSFDSVESEENERVVTFGEDNAIFTENNYQEDALFVTVGDVESAL